MFNLSLKHPEQRAKELKAEAESLFEAALKAEAVGWTSEAMKRYDKAMKLEEKARRYEQ